MITKMRKMERGKKGGQAVMVHVPLIPVCGGSTEAGGSL